MEAAIIVLEANVPVFMQMSIKKVNIDIRREFTEFGYFNSICIQVPEQSGFGPSCQWFLPLEQFVLGCQTAPENDFLFQIPVVQIVNHDSTPAV